MKKLVLVLSSVMTLSLLAGCNVRKYPPFKEGSEFTLTFDKSTRLDGGEITQKGIRFHFDENSVKEDPVDSFIEIGPYGSLYLENYVQGLNHVTVTARHTVDYEAEFMLGKSSTPNCVEYFSIYSMTKSEMTINNDMPYFSIHNRGATKLLIDKMEITGIYTEQDLEPLRSKIKVNDRIVRYDPNGSIDPYQGHEIDPNDIPYNRIVKKINEGQTYHYPGKYTYGYEVYSKDEQGNAVKMLYSSIAELSIEGSLNSGKHLAVFHTLDDTYVLEVDNHQKVDITSSLEILRTNWNSPVNDFVTPFYCDRHYYQAFNVIGMPSNKDGDGCYPVSARYTLLDKSFVMPDPMMMDGYQFGGWYMDHELTTPFNPHGSYSSDLTLYAKCIETSENFRKVYYYDYDERFLNRIDILYEDNRITLPTFEEVGTALTGVNALMYEVRVGNNRVEMLKPERTYDNGIGHYDGDRLTYDMIKDYHGDIYLYVSKFEFYQDGPGQFTRFFQDSDGYDVISGLRMSETYKEGDYILPGRYLTINKTSWAFDFDTYTDISRSDEFLVTDEVHGYIIDQGSYNSISTYGYGNKNYAQSKPLTGILRHDSVLKVGRRAFFNRYGLEGTYFPKNAREFDTESYANTTFNDVLLLPTTLQKIGPRAFLGSKNIRYVALPKSLKSVGKNAFALGTYSEETYDFSNIRSRTQVNEQIVFYYEGTEAEFNRLDDITKNEILDNALKVVYNYQYQPYYGR